MPQVSEIMSTNVHVIQPQQTLRAAARLMQELDVGALPVCDGEPNNGPRSSSRRLPAERINNLLQPLVLLDHLAAVMKSLNLANALQGFDRS